MEFTLRNILSKLKNKAVSDYSMTENPIADEVEKYYDEQTHNYMASYGNILQFSRPSSDLDLINYLSDSIGLEDGMKVLDAGCGVCGPAVEFAKRLHLKIEAITISNVQVNEAKKNINENTLKGSINVIKGDFAELDSYYSAETFDKIYFMETLGYSANLEKVIKSAISVLKKGGSIYIKDAFLAPLTNSESKRIQHENNQNIRIEYQYKVLDILDVFKIMRSQGLYVEFIRPLNISEDFTIPLHFESQTNHSSMTKVLNIPFQLYESLEVKFKKTY